MSIRLSKSSLDPLIGSNPYVPPSNFYYDADDDDVTEKLSDLLKTTWKLYTVSPLFNLSHEDETLRKFELTIKQELLNLKKKDVNYRVSLEFLPDVTMSENDEKALKINIQSITKLKRNISLFYEGIFLSWRSTASKNASNQIFINLPLLLCSGNVSNISSTHLILSRLFDCVFGKFEFSQFDFKWLSCIAIKCAPISANSLNYVYCLPNEKNAKISVKMSMDEVKNCWDNISIQENITYEDVNQLIAALQEHFLNTYNIDLNYFHLKSIFIPKALSINNGGKIRVHTVQMMDSLLKYFNSICTSRRLKT